jgi:hypothetical protein
VLSGVVVVVVAALVLSSAVVKAVEVGVDVPVVVSARVLIPVASAPVPGRPVSAQPRRPTRTDARSQRRGIVECSQVMRALSHARGRLGWRVWRSVERRRTVGGCADILGT